MNLHAPLTPRHADGVLRVIIPGRVSTDTQDIASNASQHEDVEKWLDRVSPGPKQVWRFSDQVSGWVANRESMVEAMKLIEAGEADAVVACELREVYRNPAFHWQFVFDCVDNDVRVIFIYDAIDTADPNWEIMMYAASMRHGMTVPESRRRVRRKANFSFKQGGMVLKVRFGYRKLTVEEAASGTFGPVGLRIAKVPECTPTLKRIRLLVIQLRSYVQVADILNAEGVSPGPYVTGGQWTGRLVKGLLGDAILSGRRKFRVHVHKLRYKTGKSRREPNPAGPESKAYPDLAHFTEEEHAEVLAVMAEIEQRPKADQRTGKDSPLWRRPRNRSLWPGQHAVCGACGGLMYRYGHSLRCENTLSAGTRACWNHVQVKHAEVHAKVLPWLMGVLDSRPGARDQVIDVAWKEYQAERRRRRSTGGSISDRLAQLTRERDNVTKAIRIGGPLESLVAELARLESTIAQVRREKELLDGRDKSVGEFSSREEVAARLGEIVRQMAEASFDFADLMRRWLPGFVIRPVQALDCSQVRPRAELTVRLASPNGGGEPANEESTAIDLFEPPEHVRHMAACAAAQQAHPKWSLRDIGNHLGICYMTVKRAFAYHRLMRQAGLTDPYRVLTEKPAEASRWGKRNRRETG